MAAREFHARLERTEPNIHRASNRGDVSPTGGGGRRTGEGSADLPRYPYRHGRRGDEKASWRPSPASTAMTAWYDRTQSPAP
jgi:hypothetical protein